MILLLEAVFLQLSLQRQNMMNLHAARYGFRYFNGTRAAYILQR